MLTFGLFCVGAYFAYDYTFAFLSATEMHEWAVQTLSVGAAIFAGLFVGFIGVYLIGLLVVFAVGALIVSILYWIYDIWRTGAGG